MHLYKTQLMLVVEAKTNCMLEKYIHTHERAINLPNAHKRFQLFTAKTGKNDSTLTIIL